MNGYLFKVQFHVQKGRFPLILQNGKMRREARKMENSEERKKRRREAPTRS